MAFKKQEAWKQLLKQAHHDNFFVAPSPIDGASGRLNELLNDIFGVAAQTKRHKSEQRKGTSNGTKLEN